MIEFASDAFDCLSSSERQSLRNRADSMPQVKAALRQLARVLGSHVFGRVHRKTRSFLDFVVAKTLIGHGEQIKEMTVAIRVFRESTDFNPLESSKVRVAGAALRRRLAAYYACEGKRDPVRITIPVGTYVPRIRFCERRANSRPASVTSRNDEDAERDVP
jgi:hypothetical protein